MLTSPTSFLQVIRSDEQKTSVYNEQRWATLDWNGQKSGSGSGEWYWIISTPTLHSFTPFTTLPLLCHSCTQRVKEWHSLFHSSISTLSLHYHSENLGYHSFTPGVKEWKSDHSITPPLHCNLRRLNTYLNHQIFLLSNHSEIIHNLENFFWQIWHLRFPSPMCLNLWYVVILKHKFWLLVSHIVGIIFLFSIKILN